MSQQYVITVARRYPEEPDNYVLDDPEEGLTFTILKHRATRFATEGAALEFIKKKLRRKAQFTVVPAP